MTWLGGGEIATTHPIYRGEEVRVVHPIYRGERVVTVEMTTGQMAMRCFDCGHRSNDLHEMAEPPLKRGDAIEYVIQCGACGGRDVRCTR